MEHLELSVEDTNSAALVAKLSAIRLGYFSDPFASKFIKSTEKKETIINRGYWARVEGIKMITERFLKQYENQKKQIISLGAGYDTLYFNLKVSKKYNFESIKYVEVDLQSVVHNKIKILQHHKDMLEIINSEKECTMNKELTELHGTDYAILSVDLRDADMLSEKLKSVGIDFTIPTLVFAECVLIYLPAKQSDDIMKYFAEHFECVYLMNWEMMKLNDQFGKVMIQNFEERGIDLLGIFDYPDVPSLKKRFETLGYQHVEVYDMLTIYNNYLNPEERKRVEKIEWLDEYEEWFLIQRHYYLALCSKFKENVDKKDIVRISLS